MGGCDFIVFDFVHRENLCGADVRPCVSGARAWTGTITSKRGFILAAYFHAMFCLRCPRLHAGLGMLTSRLTLSPTVSVNAPCSFYCFWLFYPAPSELL